MPEVYDGPDRRAPTMQLPHWLAMVEHFERRLAEHAEEEMLRYDRLEVTINDMNSRLREFMDGMPPFHQPPCQPLVDVHAAFIQDKVSSKPDFVGHRLGHETMEDDRKENKRTLRNITIAVITAAAIAAASWTFYALKAAAMADIQQTLAKERPYANGTQPPR